MEADRELKEASTAPASMTCFSIEPGLQLDKMNLDGEESSEEQIHIQVKTCSDVLTFASKAKEKGNKKNKPHSLEEEKER